MDEPVYFCGLSKVPPVPYDPENSTGIWATGIYGGVQIKVGIPNKNPASVSFIRLYRGTTDDFSLAQEIKTFSGFDYFDKFEPDTVSQWFYYWAVVVSISGTEFEPVGYAKAKPFSTMEEVLESLKDQIGFEFLRPELIERLGKITELEEGLSQEASYRRDDIEAIGTAFNSIQATFNDLQGLYLQEVTVRADNDSALANQIMALQVSLNDNLVQYQDEINLEIETIGGGLTQLGERVTTLQSQTENSLSTVQNQITVTNTKVDNHILSTAQDINTVQTSLGNQIATVQQSLETVGSTVDGMSSKYSVVVDANGVVGGFQLMSGGDVTDFIVNVDRFFLGRTLANGKRPFMMVGDRVYLDNTTIQDASITSAKVGDLQSSNYVAGQRGWRLDKNGNLEFNGAVAGGGRLSINNQLIRVYDANGTMRVRLGIW